MRFGHIQLDDAEGAILAHTLHVEGGVLKKGRFLSADDVYALGRAGITKIVAARLDSDDLHEDPAADRLARAVAVRDLRIGAAFTGRCNLYAQSKGLVLYQQALLDRLNLVDEAITLAALPPYHPVLHRQMVATIKIIPYGVSRQLVEQAEELLKAFAGLIQLVPFQSKAVGLVQTQLAGTKVKLLDRTRNTLRARLESCGSRLHSESRCAHDPAGIADSLQQLLTAGCDLLLIAGASATTDRRDVLPMGIESAGGVVERLGMPVDPGNLLVMGRCQGDVPVLGLPGCARSPAINGLDFVLQRLLAGLPLSAEEIGRMGGGGLLKGVPGFRSFRTDVEQGDPASKEPVYPAAPRIAALVLAAGSSDRMGEQNKLLLSVSGKPMVRQVVEQALASQADSVSVVLGHEAELVGKSLADVDVHLVENPSYREGLSSSLRAGIEALPNDVDGVLVCLADMPWVNSSDLNRLIAGYSELDGRLVCVPTWQGKRGNPVLWGKRFFDEIMALGGDQGARKLIERHNDVLCEVPMSQSGVLRDIDNQEEARLLAGSVLKDG
ncbi:MAG: molybdopterin-binding/glycosyltransferase family 2 protein [Candidatus Thiodiazotropha sp. (ex Lucinoma kastoroae)]|nr:molybdopterin-binding/glycosyltransferase family 2 protein [Candidatus Thiodiazotropha sp. (ex Lucinoma kastoroae)]